VGNEVSLSQCEVSISNLKRGEGKYGGDIAPYILTFHSQSQLG
jgi:hypothetical protein